MEVFNFKGKGYLLLLSDLHLKGKYESVWKNIRLQKIVNFCNSLDVPLVLNGDIFDCDTISSIKRFGMDTRDRDKTLNDVIDFFEIMFKPLLEKKLIKVMLGGNHEKRVFKDTKLDLIKLLCDRYGIFYGEGQMALISFSVGHYCYLFYMAHGVGSAQTEEESLKHVRKLNRIVENADVYILGHHHKTALTPYNVLRYDSRNKTLSSIRKWNVVLPSLEHWEDSYAQEKLYGISSHLPVLAICEGDEHKKRDVMLKYLDLDKKFDLCYSIKKEKKTEEE